MKTKLLCLSKAPGYTTIGVQAFDEDEAGNDKPLEDELESCQLSPVLAKLKGLARTSGGGSRDCLGQLRASGSLVSGVDFDIDLIEIMDDHKTRRKAFRLHLSHVEARALALQLMVSSIENKEHLNRELDKAREKLAELEAVSHKEET